ncbi:MAG: sodium:solute symporter family protein [Cyclobacteriaceae bacterium]
MLVLFIPLYIAVTLAIGFWASKRIKTSTDFTLAGKSLSTSFVGVTLFATWFGSSSIMGTPGHFVENGVSSFVTLIFSVGVCLVIVGSLYVKKLYKLGIVTIGDYFCIRYNKKVDLAISCILVFTYPHWIAAQFVALGFLFQSVLGIPLEYGILLGAAVVIIYTYIGGMWAVSYTDMLQSIMILVGLFILLYNILGQTGGVIPLFDNKPDQFYSIFPNGGVAEWSEYLAILLAYVIGTIPAQEIYQRAFSAKSERAAINGVYLGALLLVIIPIVPLIIALGAAMLYPELMGNNGQNIIPDMVSLHASMPVQVLFYGALISAILSTSSGAMLAPATIVGENLIRPYYPAMTDKKLLLYTRLSVILVAAVSCYFAYSDADIVGLVVASISLLLVCVFAPFTFGLFWKKSSIFGAWCAIIIGGLTWLVCFLMSTEIDPTLYGTPASCLAMVVGSLIKPDA